MKAVLDANVLVSGLNKRTSGAPAIILNQWQDGRFELVVSQHILDKVGAAWRKPYYRQFFDEEEIADLLSMLAFAATPVTPAKGIHGVADDDEDDLVLATAVAADADYLVTGDKGLLDLGEFRGIPIVTPRAFLDEIDAYPIL